MKFIVNGYDYKDENALNRRTDARDSHLDGINKMFDSKKIIMAAAMLNEKEEMCGSVLIVEYATREELDAWLETESYIINKVWEKVEVIPCKVPAMFLK